MTNLEKKLDPILDLHVKMFCFILFYMCKKIEIHSLYLKIGKSFILEKKEKKK